MTFLKKRLISLILFLSLSGCGITIGPKVEERTVWVQPGTPGKVAEQTKVKLAVKKADGTFAVQSQDIGGWVCFPPDVWGDLKKEIEEARK